MNNKKNQLISKILIFISGTRTKYKYHQDKTSPLKVRFKAAKTDRSIPGRPESTMTTISAAVGKWAASHYSPEEPGGSLLVS